MKQSADQQHWSSKITTSGCQASSYAINVKHQLKCSRQWRIVRLLLAVGAFAIGSVFVEISFSMSRFDLIPVTEEVKADVLRIEEIPTLAPSINDTSNETKYLPYDENFTYPLNVNFVSLINDAIAYGKSIPLPVINPHPYPYLIRPTSCHLPTEPSKSQKSILVLVKSYIGNVDQRIAIRMLWEKVKDPYMSKFFILGTYSNDVRIKRWHIDQERKLYKDIIMEDFEDTYLNNTIKTIMAFNWVRSSCPQADLILFHDDDYHVMYDQLASYLRDRANVSPLDIYIGSLAVNAPPYREKHERWYVTYDDYPYNVFPPYVGGGAFVVSKDVARKFQLAFPFIRYLGIDDVYLGIVAKKLSIVPKNESKLDTISVDAFAKECSHDAEKVLMENCTLAITKREITALRDKMEKYMEERNIEDIHIEFNLNNRKNYWSFDHNFSYPLRINLQSFVNARLRNRLKNRYNPLNVFRHQLLFSPTECVFKKSKVYNRNILVLVKSYVKNFEQREAIRKMWNSTYKNDIEVKVVFLLGLGLHSDIQEAVDHENSTHGDVLQAHFIDHYKNNTLKTVMAFNWGVEKCKNSDLLLFLDDDFYVHKKRLLTYLRSIPKQRYMFSGNVIKGQLPFRGLGHRWSLDETVYPFDKLPTYVNGGAFIMSYDVALKFQIAFPYVKYLSIDDVYLGIVAKKLNIIPRHDEYFDPKEKGCLAYECSHIASRLLTHYCPLSGRIVISNTTKLIKRQDGLWNRMKLINSLVFSTGGK